VAYAVEPVARQARRRPLRDRIAGGSVPYLLILPATAVIVAVLGYPLWKIVALSFQKYGLFELIRHSGTWIGTANYAHILHDHEFWTVLLRTAVFTVVNVGLTMTLGTLVALLLAQLGRAMRLLLTTGLVLVWAMPPVVSVNIWNWMVDYEFGVANWTLTRLHLGDFMHHDWFVNPLQGFAVITAIVVWGAIPFVAITVYAGLTQVPGDLVEAASIDGAGPIRIFRDMTVPILKPIFVILTSLSVIWDFQVFSQIWIIRNYRPESDYYLISIYSFVTSFNQSNYGLGSAIALVMVLVMLGVTFVYIRQMVRLGEV
jgi:N,N'-diacetylchitobiose transport system permease protein